jgi:hypothetical protein
VASQSLPPSTTLEPPGTTRRVLGRILVGMWGRLQPPVRPAKSAMAAPSDNVQRTLNLIMPLRDRSPVGRALLLQLFQANADVILSALHNVGTVHSARFDILDGKLCLFSVYDGDFDGYIRDFIVSVGPFFNGVMQFVEDPPLLPVEHYVEEFVDWVAARDLFQLPEDISELCPDVKHLPRQLTVLLREYPDLQIFSYSQYPSFSAAQIRDHLHLGW